MAKSARVLTELNVKKPDNTLKKDYGNIALLLFLYFLQGLPLGLTGSLPYILSSKNASYADQGTFSFAFWPFSIKLLWAPLVDSIYVKRFGVRKSWLVPVQYLIGTFMFTFADYVHELLELNKNDTTNPSQGIYMLTGIFFMFTFLAATQDIVVDAWALTMLSKENVSWGSTCNSVGQTAGWFLGNVIFLVLESKDFSNKYIRPVFGLPLQDYGLVTFKSFMIFFGFVFIITTTLIMLFKKETDQSSQNEDRVESQSETDDGDDQTHEEQSISYTYNIMWKLTKISNVRKLMAIQLTYYIAFAAEAMAILKLIEYGVPKESLGLLAVPLTPFEIIFPLLLSKYSNGPRPLTFLLTSIKARMCTSLISCLLVYLTPYFKDTNNEYPMYYYLVCLLINGLHILFICGMSSSMVSFYARISDKKVGGTYMTFLNTISNLGYQWPNTLSFYLASLITIKKCEYNAQTGHMKSNEIKNVTIILQMIENNFCQTGDQVEECLKNGGACNTTIDPFYVLTFVCTVFGLFWIYWVKNLMYRLESLSASAWIVKRNNNDKIK